MTLRTILIRRPPLSTIAGRGQALLLLGAMQRPGQAILPMGTRPCNNRAPVP